MRLQVKGKNHEVSDTIRRYAEEKMQKLDRQLHELAEVELELRVEKNPSIADNQVAEATVRSKGPTLRVTEASSRHEGLDRPADREADPPDRPCPREAAQGLAST